MLTFSFPPGSAVDGRAPRGYRLLEQHRPLGSGRVDLERLGSAVLAWRLQRGSGVAVETADRAPAPSARVGLDAVLRVPIVRVGRARLRIAAPVRVTRVVAEPDRVGFAYGTVRGHPEIGEEAFLVALSGDDRVVLTVRSISRTALPYALALPVARGFQRRFTGRYLRALDDA